MAVTRRGNVPGERTVNAPGEERDLASPSAPTPGVARHRDGPPG